MTRAPIAIAVATIVLGPAPSVAGGTTAPASLTAPAAARLGSRVTVHAIDVDPGRYRLFLEYTLLAPVGVTPTGCLAPIGGAVTAVRGRVTISGRLPRRLACHQAEGPVLGHLTVHAGRYALDFGGFLAPAGFTVGQTFIKRAIRLTG